MGLAHPAPCTLGVTRNPRPLPKPCLSSLFPCCSPHPSKPAKGMTPLVSRLFQHLHATRHLETEKSSFNPEDCRKHLGLMGNCSDL